MKGGEKRFLLFKNLKKMTKEPSILEKSSERQIKLALILGMADSDCDTLAQQLNITKKTLLSDVVFFNHTYSPIAINIDQYQITSLNIPSDQNLEDLMKQILNHSTNIQILKHIFIEEITLSKLSETLFLSETSIRRIILKINTYFKSKKLPISIHLTTKPKIIGDEIFIRHFFCSMFRELYPPQHLPHFEHLFEILKRYYEKSNSATGISTYKLILNSYYFYISLIRIGHHHLVEVSPTENCSTTSIFFDLLQKNTVLCSIIEKNYQCKITRAAIQDIIQSGIYLFENRADNHKKNECDQLHTLAQRFYTQLNIVAPLSTEEKQQLQDFIHFNQELQSFKTTYIEILSDLLIKHSPKLLVAYDTAIEEVGLTNIKKNHFLYEELLLELITLSPQLLATLFPHKAHFSILIISYQEERILSFYKQLLLKKLPALHSIDTYKGNIFKLDYQKINQYDLILTDIELNKSRITTQMLKISKVPISSFWNNLEEILYT